MAPTHSSGTNSPDATLAGLTRLGLTRKEVDPRGGTRPRGRSRPARRRDEFRREMLPTPFAWSSWARPTSARRCTGSTGAVRRMGRTRPGAGAPARRRGGARQPARAHRVAACARRPRAPGASPALQPGLEPDRGGVLAAQGPAATGGQGQPAAGAVARTPVRPRRVPHLHSHAGYDAADTPQALEIGELRGVQPG